MWPFIRDGDVLEIRPVLDQPLFLGEIVLILVKDTTLYVHRIVKFKGEDGAGAVVTQGDRVLEPDGPIPRERILGRVVAYQRQDIWYRLDGKFRRLENRFIAQSLPFIKRLFHRFLSGSEFQEVRIA